MCHVPEHIAQNIHQKLEAIERLITGDYPLNIFREYRGLTDEQLESSAGAPYLS
jgi:hypothetical protein